MYTSEFLISGDAAELTGISLQLGLWFFLSFHQRQQIIICLVFFPGSLFCRQYTYSYISPRNTMSSYGYLIRTRIYPLFDYMNSTLRTHTSFDCTSSQANLYEFDPFILLHKFITIGGATIQKYQVNRVNPYFYPKPELQSCRLTSFSFFSRELHAL